jgi:glycosyltransferase involved in cell wall biosynthesis
MKSVRVFHETNPTKYFGSLLRLQENNSISLSGLHRTSIIKEWLRSGIRDKISLRERTRNALGDLKARLQIPFLKNEVVVIGMAPWDFRILWFLMLRSSVDVIYHTSWHTWSDVEVPRHYGPLNFLLRSLWRRFLVRRNVRVVAVHGGVAKSIERYFDGADIEIEVIPHSISPEFLVERECVVSKKKKILFVGELSRKKGVLDFSEYLINSNFDDWSLTIVGDGDLRDEVVRLASVGRVRYEGKVRDRTVLANIYRNNDFLIVPSIRVSGWEELFGMVIIEALAAGLVVISTDHIGPRTIFLGHDYPVFCEREYEGMMRFIESLNPVDKVQLLNAGREIAVGYTPDVVDMKWMSYINA